MDTIKEYIIPIFSFVFILCSFFIGRLMNAKSEGANFAIMKTDIEYIKTAIGDIKTALQDADKTHDESIRRLHDRIDKHEQTYHRAK